LTVREYLNSLPHRVELPVVGADKSLEEVVRAMVKGHRRRVVYVVDSQNRFLGAILLGDLKNVVFRYFLKRQVSDALVVSEHITELFTSEKAEDIMDTDTVICYEDESLHCVIGRMMEADLTDIPVLDHDRRVIADLDILDLLALWLQKGEEVF
jgi:CBS domain-containing protein